MNNFQKLSETEMEVMQIIWASGHPITSGELLDIFARNKGKEWKGQTMATFLARLVEKIYKMSCVRISGKRALSLR